MNAFKGYFRILCGALLLVGIFSATTVQAQTAVFVNGPSNVVAGTSGFFTASKVGAGTVTSYSWYAALPNGASRTGSGTSFTVAFPNTCGYATITLTATIRETNGNVHVDNINHSVYVGGVAPATPSSIAGATGVCSPNSTESYSIPAVANASTYTWTVTGGLKIVHPGTGALVTTYTGTQRTINVRFPSSGSANAQVKVYATNNNPCPTNGGTRVLDVKFGPQTFAINGPSSVERFGSANFSLTGYGVGGYNWTLPQGFNSGNGLTGQTVQVNILAAQGGWIYVSYKSCGADRTSSKYVTVYTPSGGGGFGDRAALDLEGLENGLSLYPNPALDEVTVVSESSITSITVMNLAGQVVKTLDQVSGKQAQVDVRGLQPGSYLLLVEGDDSKQVHKLLVE